MPQTKTQAKPPITVIVAPTHAGGTLGRIVEFPDGAIVTQIWNGHTWVADKQRVIQVLKGRRAGDTTMNAYAIPLSDRGGGELP